MLINILYYYDKRHNKSYLENLVKDNEQGINLISKYLNSLEGKEIPPYVGHLTLIELISKLASNIEICTKMLEHEDLENLDIMYFLDKMNEKTYQDFGRTWKLENIDEEAKYLYWKTIKIRCKNNGKIFNTTKEASEWCGLKTRQRINDNANGKIKSAGKDPITGKKLTWEHIIEYESLL